MIPSSWMNIMWRFKKNSNKKKQLNLNPNKRKKVNRYNQNNTDNRLLTVQPDIKSNNGLTTLKYQDSETLNVYPEYGILFEDDNDSDFDEGETLNIC